MWEQDTHPSKMEWDDIRHYIVIPNYKESYETLAATLEHLAKFTLASTHFCIVLAMEAREENHQEKAERLIEQFSGQFKEVLFCAHPHGIPNEVPGKASNENWAAKFIIAHVEERMEDLKRSIVSVTDADSHFHLNYFDCLTYKYCVDPDRQHKTYQSPMFGLLNYYDVPAFLRCLATNFTVHELACLSDPFDHHIPFSTYSMSLLTIKNVDGWDADNITEDWHMYLKSYFLSHGDHVVEPILLPTTNYIIESDGYYETIKARFVQSQRHMWSFYEVAFMWSHSLTSPQTWMRNFVKTLNLHFKVLYVHALSVVPLPVLVLANLMILWSTFINPNPWIIELSATTQMLQTISILLTIGIISVNTYCVNYCLKGKEKNYGFKSTILYNALEYTILNNFAAILLVFAPTVHSLTKLMFTDKLNYVVAAKPTIKEENNNN